MTSFGRTDRQDVLWDLFQVIRDFVGVGLLDPTEAEYAPVAEGDPDLEDLQADWDDLVVEYTDIHTDNETKG